MNLIETIQQNLGYDKLHKIDPNKHDVNKDEKTFGAHSLSQAAIPAILCGLFNHLENRDTAEVILEGDSSNWLNTIFKDKTEELLRRLAEYAKISGSAVRPEAEHIANEAVRITREKISDKKDYRAVSNFVSSNKTETLLYLPASMQIGNLLHNNNLDDQTNKMEGPVSTFMHKIEQQFNSYDE